MTDPAGAPARKAVFSKNDPIAAALILFLIATLVTLALAGANELTKDQIAAQKAVDLANAQNEVFSDAVSFEDLSKEYVTANTPGIESVYRALDGKNRLLGLVVVSFAKGYGGNVRVMSAISLDRSILGIAVLSDDETPGLGKKVREAFFKEQFIGRKPGLLFSLKDEADANAIDAVTGATISSSAVTGAVNGALRFAGDVYAGLQ